MRDGRRRGREWRRGDDDGIGADLNKNRVCEVGPGMAEKMTGGSLSGNVGGRESQECGDRTS